MSNFVLLSHKDKCKLRFHRGKMPINLMNNTHLPIFKQTFMQKPHGHSETLCQDINLGFLSILLVSVLLAFCNRPLRSPTGQTIEIQGFSLPEAPPLFFTLVKPSSLSHTVGAAIGGLDSDSFRTSYTLFQRLPSTRSSFALF